MNATLRPEVLLGVDATEPGLQLATEGVRRYAWQSRFGAILIEVKERRLGAVVPDRRPSDRIALRR
jgi:hypothetical protein